MNLTICSAEELLQVYLDAGTRKDVGKQAAVVAELQRRAANANPSSRAPAALAKIATLNQPKSSTCARCDAGDCPLGHVYVLELQVGDAFIYAVGSTGKRVEERFADNFNVLPSGKFKYNSPNTRKIRSVGREHIRFAVELFAARNPVCRQGDAKGLLAAEGALAAELRFGGYEVLCDR